MVVNPISGILNLSLLQTLIVRPLVVRPLVVRTPGYKTPGRNDHMVVRFLVGGTPGYKTPCCCRKTPGCNNFFCFSLRNCECLVQGINSRKINLHLTFSGNLNNCNKV